METKHQLPDNNLSERFESDTDKIVHRHLADKNHVITEEELQSIRVGQTPLTNEAAEEMPDTTEKAADRKTESETGIIPGAEKVTPWDVVE